MQERQCRKDGAGETVEERQWRKDGAGKTTQERRCGKDGAGNTVQHTGKKGTANPRNKNHGLPEEPRLLWKNSAGSQEKPAR